MRDLNRIEPLLSLIRTIWTANPDLRLMQLLNTAFHDVPVDPFYTEDSKLTYLLIAVYHKDLDDESVRGDS